MKKRLLRSLRPTRRVSRLKVREALTGDRRQLSVATIHPDGAIRLSAVWIAVKNPNASDRDL